MNKYEVLMQKKYGQRYMAYREAFKSHNMEIDLAFPLHVDLDLVDACNLKCPTCHSIARSRNRQTMEFDLVKQIIHECNEYDTPAINIGGCSEPLIKKQLTIDTLYSLKNTSFMDIFLHTNGVLLDEDFSKSLISAGLTYLCVSIDAVTQQTFDKIRGTKLSTIIENIEKFLSARAGELPVLRVSFLATTLNMHEKDEFVKYWEKKADVVEIQNYVKPYSSMPDIALSEKIIEKQSISYRREKRIAIVAPEYLCLSCNGIEVSNAVDQSNTFSKYSTIKNYWDNVVLNN